MTAFPALLDKLQRRIDLTEDEAAGAMETIMDGCAQPSQIAGLLVGMAMKGERPDEIVGLARTMRARATKLSRTFAPAFDTCGTGGDGAHTFNVSTLAALVIAACGVRVAKHGNRSASSRCGSADLFEALRLPCFATRTPHAASTSAATVDTLNVCDPSPPVPQVSNTGENGRDSFVALALIVRARPTISSGRSPFIARPTRRPAI